MPTLCSVRLLFIRVLRKRPLLFVTKTAQSNMSKPTATVGTAEMQPSRPAPSSSAGLHAGESSTLLDPEKQSTAGKTARKTSKLYMLKLSHHTLTSLVSIAIAALQLIIYLSYQHGKNIPGAWPNKPYLIPTLLLLGVAVAALGFDICAIVAYCLPSSRSSKNLDRTAKGFGMLITGLKGLGFAVAASSGKTAFDGGTNSAKNNDLWGWSCSDQAAQMQSVNNASTNCLVTVSWTDPSLSFTTWTYIGTDDRLGSCTRANCPRGSEHGHSISCCPSKGKGLRSGCC